MYKHYDIKFILMSVSATLISYFRQQQTQVVNVLIEENRNKCAWISN